MTDSHYVMSHSTFVKLVRVRTPDWSGFEVHLAFPAGPVETSGRTLAETFETTRHVLEHYDYAANNNERSAG